jgi:hypothetical protein
MGTSFGGNDMRLNATVLMFFFSVSTAIAAFPTGENPIDTLPSHIATEKSKITLFADYDNKRKDGKFDVFLINRSNKELTLGAQDGDVYLKTRIPRRKSKMATSSIACLQLVWKQLYVFAEAPTRSFPRHSRISTERRQDSKSSVFILWANY